MHLSVGQLISCEDKVDKWVWWLGNKNIGEQVGECMNKRVID